MNVFQCETGTYNILMKCKFVFSYPSFGTVSEGFHSTLLDQFGGVSISVQCYEPLKTERT